MNSQRVPDISIVVPVFNSAAFVRESVLSALEQTLAAVEVLCVDDGSTDGSAAVLGEMAASDSRITLVSLGSNQGASAARNTGIERATGKYVFFLDSDDRVPPGALDLLLSAATATGSPLTIGKLLWFRTEEESVLPVKNAPGEPMVTTNIRESAYLQSIPGCHCCNLYSRDMLERHRIRYDTDLSYGEDQLFQAAAMIHASKVTIVDEVVYVYHHYRSQSLTRRPPSLRNLLDDIEFQCRIARLFSAHGLREAGLRFLGSWSYAIRQYWLQIPTALSRDEATCVFEAFRAMVDEFGVQPWNDATPEHHRHLLRLIMDGQDERAMSFLATEEAHAGQPATTRSHDAD